MGYKKMKQNLGFADFALANSMKHNRSLKNMEKLNQSIDWDRINTILLSHYSVGTSSEGADAYPPLLLYKCLFLQQWFHPGGIDSAPVELNTPHLVKTSSVGFNWVNIPQGRHRFRSRTGESNLSSEIRFEPFLQIHTPIRCL